VLHDFPYDIHSYEGVIPRLADRHEHGYMVEQVMELLDQLTLSVHHGGSD
jgi:hypothetical protein